MTKPSAVSAEALAYADSLYNLARYRTGDDADAEDLVQDTYVRAQAAEGALYPGTNLEAWLFRILRNAFIDTRRRRRTNPVDGGLDTVSAPIGADVKPTPKVRSPSSGIHEVKPWFAGKLDFAPARAFAGNDDFLLRGGAVTHFLDRKAAAFVYGRRPHTISLFVFRADGVAWPRSALTSTGRVDARVATERGFSTIVWRDGELGYALASDIDPKELLTLGALVAGTN